jgi:N-acetylneuraminate synthase
LPLATSPPPPFSCCSALFHAFCSAFSLEPAELAELVNTSRITQATVGKPTFGPTTSEASVLKNRRSLYVVKPIAKGERLTLDNIRSIRPANGLKPKHFDSVIGRRATRDLAFGEPLAFNMVELITEVIE